MYLRRQTQRCQFLLSLWNPSYLDKNASFFFKNIFTTKWFQKKTKIFFCLFSFSRHCQMFVRLFSFVSIFASQSWSQKTIFGTNFMAKLPLIRMGSKEFFIADWRGSKNKWHYLTFKIEIRVHFYLKLHPNEAKLIDQRT
jgi:hypothetical protein